MYHIYSILYVLNNITFVYVLNLKFSNPTVPFVTNIVVPVLTGEAQLVMWRINSGGKHDSISCLSVYLKTNILKYILKWFKC